MSIWNKGGWPRRMSGSSLDFHWKVTKLYFCIIVRYDYIEGYYWGSVQASCSRILHLHMGKLQGCLGKT